MGRRPITDGSTGMSPEALEAAYRNPGYHRVAAGAIRYLSHHGEVRAEDAEDWTQDAWLRVMGCSSDSSTGYIGAMLKREIWRQAKDAARAEERLRKEQRDRELS